ncbi:MAG: hypothetical protein Q8S13_14010 [Dehalococcoidia bacterium]|nr:hypothetical protein [Dehalococcoidia bacterium]
MTSPKIKSLTAKLAALEESWKNGSVGGLPFPTSYKLVREAIELLEDQEEALSLAVRQLVHLPEAEWKARRSATADERLCPCDHWQAFMCDTCRGACSCHWRQPSPPAAVTAE